MYHLRNLKCFVQVPTCTYIGIIYSSNEMQQNVVPPIQSNLSKPTLNVF